AQSALELHGRLRLAIEHWENEALLPLQQLHQQQRQLLDQQVLELRTLAQAGLRDRTRHQLLGRYAEQLQRQRAEVGSLLPRSWPSRRWSCTGACGWPSSTGRTKLCCPCSSCTSSSVSCSTSRCWSCGPWPRPACAIAPAISYWGAMPSSCNASVPRWAACCAACNSVSHPAAATYRMPGRRPGRAQPA